MSCTFSPATIRASHARQRRVEIVHSAPREMSAEQEGHLTANRFARCIPTPRKRNKQAIESMISARGAQSAVCWPTCAATNDIQESRTSVPNAKHATSAIPPARSQRKSVASYRCVELRISCSVNIVNQLRAATRPTLRTWPYRGIPYALTVPTFTITAANAAARPVTLSNRMLGEQTRNTNGRARPL